MINVGSRCKKCSCKCPHCTAMQDTAVRGRHLETESAAHLEVSYSCWSCWIIDIYAFVMCDCLWMLTVNWADSLSTHSRSASISADRVWCIRDSALATATSNFDAIIVLHGHRGWVSGNHLGDIILLTGLSPGETVETHPYWCRMTRCSSKNSNLQR